MYDQTEGMSDLYLERVFHVSCSGDVILSQADQWREHVRRLIIASHILNHATLDITDIQ